MKKVCALLLTFAFAFSLAGCGGTKNNGVSQPSEEVNNSTSEQSSEAIGDSIQPQGSTDASSEGNTDMAANIDSLPESNADTAVFDLENGTVLLNSGYTMPILGIGCFTLSNDEAENSVYWALRDGYRLIDTARIYGNEEGVGRGIQRAIDEGFVTREEIFVTTKMWTSDYNDGESAIDASLRRLGLDYIDLMILHHSQPSNDVEAYQAMEKAVEEGKLRSIGLSNYYTPEDFDRLVEATTITPALLQNETHPYHQSMEMKEHLAQYGTVMESWFPLGGRGNTQTLFSDDTIVSIAEAHGKLLHRSFYAGTCRQEILQSPVPATRHISRRTMKFLTLSFPMRKCSK